VEEFVWIEQVNLVGVSFLSGFFQGLLSFRTRQISSIPQAQANQFSIDDGRPNDWTPARANEAAFQLQQSALEVHSARIPATHLG